MEAATNGPESLYRQKEMLKSAGWVVKSSSDGTTLDASGDILTSGASGAGGMNNVDSWFRIQSPDGVREFVWQCTVIFTGTWRASFRTKYVVGAFSGGTASQVPSATDEQTVKGSGTDAAPVGTAWYHTNTGDGAGEFIGCAETVHPFRFWGSSCQGSFPYGDGSLWLFDAVDGVATDEEPFVVAINNDVASTVFDLSGLGSYTGKTLCFTYWDYGGASEAFNRVVLPKYSASTAALGENVNGKRDLVPMVYAREDGQPAPGGVKGWSTMVMGVMNQSISAKNLQYETIDKNLVGRQNAALPWPDGSTITIGGAAWTTIQAQFSIPGGYQSAAPAESPASPGDANEVPKSLLASDSGGSGFRLREGSGRLL